MLLLRYCLTVSASVVIALPGMAQVVASPIDASTPCQVNPTETDSEQRISPFEFGGNEPQPAMPVRDPLKLSSDFLNPSGNPLNFPTQPSEVETTVRQPITLDNALALAYRNNRELQASRLVLEQQQANLEAQRAALFPTLSTDFTLSRDQAERAIQVFDPILGTQDVFIEQTSTNAQGNLQLSYDIYAGGERAARITQAELQVRQQNDLGFCFFSLRGFRNCPLAECLSGLTLRSHQRR